VTVSRARALCVDAVLVIVIPRFQYQYRGQRLRGSAMRREYPSHSLHPISRLTLLNCSNSVILGKSLRRAHETMRNSSWKIVWVRPYSKNSRISSQDRFCGVFRRIMGKYANQLKKPIAPIIICVNRHILLENTL
jgi:hypothetical protein